MQVSRMPTFTTVNAIAVPYLAIIIVAELEEAVRFLETWKEPIDAARALARLAGVKHLTEQANFAMLASPTAGNMPMPDAVAAIKTAIDHMKSFVVRTGADENLLNDGNYVFRTFSEIHNEVSRILTHPRLTRSTILGLIGQGDDDDDYAPPSDQAS